MTSPRIFVCYREEVQRDQTFAQQLIDDLCNAGNDIATLENIKPVTDDEQFSHALSQKLSTCEWVLLVLTPETMQSPKIALIVNTALICIMQKKIRGLFAMLAAPVEQQDMPPTWTTIRRFDATRDYPRALARLLLTLSPIDATTTYQAPPPSLQPVPSVESQHTQPLLLTDGKPISLPKLPPRQRRFQRWFVPLTIFLILSLVTGLFVYALHAFPAQSVSSQTLSASTVPLSPTMKPSPNINATTTALFANPQSFYDHVLQRTPFLNDPLKDATLHNWAVGTIPKGGCAFLKGTYDVTSLKSGYRQPCIIQNSTLKNIAFQAQMAFVIGDTSPCGLIVRMQNQVVASFRLNIYGNGNYELIGAEIIKGIVHNLGKGHVALTPHQPITLALFMRNSMFYAYINGKFVTSATDPTYKSGKIGFVCRALPTPVEAVFSNAKAWYI